MRRSDFTKAGKFATVRRLVIFNFAAIIGFVLGTISFEICMFVYANPTFAWLFANCVGGLSHFGSNWFLQGQSKKEVGVCFIVFNATGILSFLFASGTFAVSVVFVKDFTFSWLLGSLLIKEATISWLLGSLVGTMSHFVMNEKAMKLSSKSFKRCPPSEKA